MRGPSPLRSVPVPTRPVTRRARAAAPALAVPVLVVLGLLGLLGVAWIDSKASPDTARIALVVWASVGVGVLVTGIVGQWAGRTRRRGAGAGPPSAGTGAGAAADPGPAPLPDHHRTAPDRHCTAPADRG